MEKNRRVRLRIKDGKVKAKRVEDKSASVRPVNRNRLNRMLRKLRFGGA